jgi:hypothetical protein
MRCGSVEIVQTVKKKVDADFITLTCLIESFHSVDFTGGTSGKAIARQHIDCIGMSFHSLINGHTAIENRMCTGRSGICLIHKNIH